MVFEINGWKDRLKSAKAPEDYAQPVKDSTDTPKNSLSMDGHKSSLVVRIKTALGIDDWDALLASDNRHNVILSKVIPPMLTSQHWICGGVPDWMLALRLFKGKMSDIWSPTTYEVEIAEKLDAFIHEYLEFGGWCTQHEVWVKRYQNFIIAVKLNRLKLDASTYKSI